MYKIILLYQSDVKGEYVREVEIAEDLQQARYKRGAMINRWFEKICDYIDFENYIEKILSVKNNSYRFTYDEITEMRLKMIDRHLVDSNSASIHNVARFFIVDIDKECEMVDIVKECETKL